MNANLERWMLLQLMAVPQQQRSMRRSETNNDDWFQNQNSIILRSAIASNCVEDDLEPTPLPSGMVLSRVVSMPESSRATKPITSTTFTGSRRQSSQPPTNVISPIPSQPLSSDAVLQHQMGKRIDERPIHMFLTERQRCLVFVKVLLKYLPEKGVNTQPVKQVVAACVQRQRRGMCDRLTDLLEVELRKCIGEMYWQEANDRFDVYCQQTGLWTVHPTPIRV